MASLYELEKYIDDLINFRKSQKLNNIPLVINAYGGPGCGKSTTCLHLVAELKKYGFKAEYVSEYAKELVYDKKFDLLDGSLEHQIDILLEQNKRVERLVGNVDFIVSDSPIFLSYIYSKPDEISENAINSFNKFLSLVLKLDSQYNTFSFFVERNEKDFKTEGRIHSLDESIDLDYEIENFLEENDIYFGRYNHDTIDMIIPNCIKTFSRINNLDNSEIIEFLSKNQIVNQLEDLREYCREQADNYSDLDDIWENDIGALDYAIGFIKRHTPKIEVKEAIESKEEKGGKKR